LNQKIQYARGIFINTKIEHHHHRMMRLISYRWTQPTYQKHQVKKNYFFLMFKYEDFLFVEYRFEFN